MLTLEEKKNLVLQMITLHPTIHWYRQCLEMHLTAEEMDIVENDPAFLRDIQGCLFMEKQKIMSKRLDAIEKAGNRGNWQGYDKLLQEIDKQMFSLSGQGNYDNDSGNVVTVVQLPDNGRGDATTD